MTAQGINPFYMHHFNQFNPHMMPMNPPLMNPSIMNAQSMNLFLNAFPQNPLPPFPTLPKFAVPIVEGPT